MIHSSNQMGHEEVPKSKFEAEIREEVLVERHGEDVDQMRRKRFQGKYAKGEELNYDNSR